MATPDRRRTRGAARRTGDAGTLSEWLPYWRRLRDAMAVSEGLQPTTVNNYLKCIDTFYNWLVDERVLTESPVAQVSLVRRFGRVSAVADEHERRAFLKQQKFFRQAVLYTSRLDPRQDLRRVLSCVDTEKRGIGFHSARLKLGFEPVRDAVDNREGKFERRHCFEH